MTRTCPCEPVTRRVWAPVGERPTAHGHHRFDWLYVTAFASPATGEIFWYLSNGVSKPFFEALLEIFAREAEAGVGRIILLALDNAGWHGAAGLKIPDGIRLVYLPPPLATPPSSAWRGPSPAPPYSPQLQPAETLWALLDEPIVNNHIATISNSKRKSPTSASPSPSSPTESRNAPAFIGGQSGSVRTNQPETVLC